MGLAFRMGIDGVTDNDGPAHGDDRVPRVVGGRSGRRATTDRTQEIVVDRRTSVDCGEVARIPPWGLVGLGYVANGRERFALSNACPLSGERFCILQIP